MRGARGHGGHASRDHRHDHARARPDGPGIRRRLWIVLLLVVGYMAAEVVGGILSGSLALLADAGHMLSDAGSIALALFATWFASRPAPPERTFGYHRSEILAALVHGGTLIAVALFVFIEAWRRFRAPPEVEGGLLMVVAIGGLVINVIGLWVLHGGRDHNLNVKGAWLHVLTDTLGSLQAIIAGGLILLFGWHVADPIASLAIGALVLYSAWRLTREAVAVLMEGVPGHLDIDEVRSAMLRIDGVAGVHDLHVWAITSGFVALSAHVVPTADAPSAAPRAGLLRRITRELDDRFGIDHTTIQIEPPDFEGCGEPCDPGTAEAG
ncbi:MAG: cation diffusion facilitator family transporter [Gemmatimonadota bacterium]|nr:cation diffusion facilitator family transporter [Gemmatimonadota bacterium]